MNTQPLLIYALQDNNLKHITAVSNGIACNCICPHCNRPLIARNAGKINVPHFAHDRGMDCNGAYESALHYLAKTILLESKTIHFPDYHYDYNPNNSRSKFTFSAKKKRDLIFDKVVLEQKVIAGDITIIPDAIGYINDKPIFIEFANSHFIDEEKKKKLKTIGIACIEIDLANQLLDRDALHALINSDSPKKYWVCNQRMDQEYVEERKRKKLAGQQRVEAQRLQELMEKKEEIQEAWTRYHGWKKDPSVVVFPVFGGEVSGCPKKKEAIENLKNDSLYLHPVLKQIVDGAHWNGTLYGRPPKGKYIHFKNTTVVVYPPDGVNTSEEEKKESRILFRGLDMIRKVFYESYFGDCHRCMHSADHIKIEEKHYEVCKHPSAFK